MVHVCTCEHNDGRCTFEMHNVSPSGGVDCHLVYGTCCKFGVLFHPVGISMDPNFYLWVSQWVLVSTVLVTQWASILHFTL